MSTEGSVFAYIPPAAVLKEIPARAMASLILKLVKGVNDY